MWSWISCYVTGHDYSVCCDAGEMFLRCVVCGRRSQGWVVNDRDHAHAPHGTLRNTLESTTAAAR